MKEENAYDPEFLMLLDDYKNMKSSLIQSPNKEWFISFDYLYRMDRDLMRIRSWMFNRDEHYSFDFEMTCIMYAIPTVGGPNVLYERIKRDRSVLSNLIVEEGIANSSLKSEGIDWNTLVLDFINHEDGFDRKGFFTGKEDDIRRWNLYEWIYPSQEDTDMYESENHRKEEEEESDRSNKRKRDDRLDSDSESMKIENKKNKT
jgi:hypothetical protein